MGWRSTAFQGDWASLRTIATGVSPFEVLNACDPKASLPKPHWVVRGCLDSIIRHCEEKDLAASVPEQLLSMGLGN